PQGALAEPTVLAIWLSCPFLLRWPCDLSSGPDALSVSAPNGASAGARRHLSLFASPWGWADSAPFDEPAHGIAPSSPDLLAQACLGLSSGVETKVLHDHESAISSCQCAASGLFGAGKSWYSRR